MIEVSKSIKGGSEQTSDRSGPRSFTRRLLAALLIGVCGGYALATHLQLFRLLESLNYNDFGKFYYSARQWYEGAAMYGPTPASLIPVPDGGAEYFWNMNPPHFNALLLPMTFLRIGWAYVIWSVLNIAMVVIATAAVARAVGLQLPAWKWAVAAVLVAASAPVLSVSLTGQFTGLLTAAVTYIWLNTRRQEWVRAAVMIGVVGSVKPFLGPLGLLLIARRQWSAAAVALLTIAVIFLAGVLALGLGPYGDWLRVLGDVRWMGAELNASVFAPLARAVSVAVITTDGRVRDVGTALGVIMLVIAFVAMRRSRDLDNAVLIALLTSLLASPLGWIYYIPLIFGPLVAMQKNGALHAGWYVVAVGLWVPHFALAAPESRLFAATVGSIYAWSLLAFWGLSVLAVGRAEQVSIRAERQAV